MRFDLVRIMLVRALTHDAHCRLYRRCHRRLHYAFCCVAVVVLFPVVIVAYGVVVVVVVASGSFGLKLLYHCNRRLCGR